MLLHKLIGVSVTDGTDPDTLFIKYDKAGTNNTATVFTDSETVTSTTLSSSPTIVVASTHTGSGFVCSWCLLHKWFSCKSR